MAPFDYGLLVIDFVRKKIHSMQNYDNPGVEALLRFSRIYINNANIEENYELLVENNKLIIVE